MSVLKKNIAVIGCGTWGQNHVCSAHELGVLYAVSDHDPKRADVFAQKYHVKALSFDAVLKDEAVAGIILATPAPQHAPMALQALAAGKHVLVEKPIALSIEDAHKMVQAADKAKRTLMVGHVLQYHPAFMALKDLVAKGTLGTLRHIQSSRLNFGKVRTEENVFWSFAPHDVSMILALAGREPVVINAQYYNGLAQSEIASSAIVQFDFGKGLSGHIHTSWLNPFKEQKLVVIGDKGMAVFDDTLPWDKKLALYRNSVTFDKGHAVLHKADAEYVPVVESAPLAAEISHFAACMESGKPAWTDGAEGLAVLRVMQAADALALGGAREGRMKTAIITYQIPHLKTAQILERVADRDCAKNLDVFAIPFRTFKPRDVVFAHRPDQHTDIQTPDLCARHGFSYTPVAADADIPGGYDYYVITGAGILSPECVRGKKIINSHPGAIPAVRGLDAFKWAIHDMQPLANSLHYIDEAVDMGELITIEPTPVYSDDTLQSLATRHYDLEIALLARFDDFTGKGPYISNYPERAATMRMPAAVEHEMIARFDAYKKQFATQAQRQPVRESTPMQRL